MHVEVRGAGPPLLLLHGWAMHGGVFGPLADRLASRYRLHVVDLPGHGHSRDSDTPLALEPVVESLVESVPDATWLGWSLGGLFALHAAATRPRALSGLVMLCASPRFVRGDAWPYGMSAEIFQDFAAGLRSDPGATLDRFLALQALGSDDAKAELRTLRLALRARGEPAQARLADGLALLEQSDLRASLPGLGVPSLWLAGAGDRLVDPRAMRQAATSAPRSGCHVIAQSGHAPLLTHAGALAATLAPFLQACATGSVAAAARSHTAGPLPESASSSSRRRGAG
ncbi:pimeloyl-ACP methyl ester esterase BioH [soil metagenome]